MGLEELEYFYLLIFFNICNLGMFGIIFSADEEAEEN